MIPQHPLTQLWQIVAADIANKTKACCSTDMIPSKDTSLP